MRPADCATVFQAPPDFTWPAASGSNTYTVSLTFPDGHSETRSTSKNWLAWDRQIPAGRYAWKVRASGGTNEAGASRSFTVDAKAVPFVAPSGDAALARAKNTPRPRSWSRDATSPIIAAKSERVTGFAALKRDVDARLASPVGAAPASLVRNANYDITVMEQKRALNAAYAWAVTKDARYGADAARRLLAQAGWSHAGPLSFASNDMASRTVAWTLALGYDWCHDFLTDAQKATLREAIRVRTSAMYDAYVANNQITTYPYDSHGNLTLTITAAIATLMAGEIPEADTWVRGAVTMAIVWTSPWGTDDGGFGNGSMQGTWDLGSNLLAWYVLQHAAGADIGKKEWVRNHGRYLAYFTPPGSPSGQFGDGAEYPAHEQYARIARAYASFAPSDFNRWFASQQTAGDVARLELLLAPRDTGTSAALPAATPHAAVFPSIGWAAMHSRLDDPARASVYFKSSPYGSYNHSHGDQNSFTVSHKGRRLAIDSGYYDDYRTPHWTNWYKTTRAHNAITFDGGQGQGFNDKAFAGAITQFTTGTVHDAVTGQAAKAYGSALTQATRSLVYLRETNTVVVYDLVSSPVARTWEWNIHALHRMNKHSNTRVAILNAEAALCIEMLASPGVAFEQDSDFTSAPSGRHLPDQWHGRFVTTAKSTTAEFVTIMRIGNDCTPAANPAAVTRIAGGYAVALGGRTVTLIGDKAAVD